MSLVDTCKKNEENLKENFLSVVSRHFVKKNEENLKENFLSVSQYYHIRGNFLGVVYLFLFQKKMTNLVFSTAISLSIVFLENHLFIRPGWGGLMNHTFSLK